MRSLQSAFAFLAVSALTMTFSLHGCRGQMEESGPQSGESREGMGGSLAGIGAGFAERDADELFSQEEVPVFKVSLPEANWQQLQKDALLEEYVAAALEYQGQNIGDVGLRYKGAVGSLTACFDDEGNRTCDKLSMKLKFNEVDRDLRFFGLKKLNFHSMLRDQSKLADKIAYKVFRDAGVAAPRTTWARLEINGESLGLFALVEQIDGRFTKDRFAPEGDGDLYKEAWPQNTDPAAYTDSIKTNEELATHDKIVRFSQAMESAAPGDRLATLSRWTSLEAMYTFMAAQDAIAQWDGLPAWYCSSYGCSPHNFYIYSQETTDHFTLIPWDMDSTLNPSTPMDHVPHWTVANVDCDKRYGVFATTTTQAPGCDPILGGLASDLSQYAEAVDALLADAFDISKIEEDIDRYVEFIRDEVELDEHGGSAEAWLGAVERLKAALPLLKLRLESYRDGSPAQPLLLSLEGPTTFESVNALELDLGVRAMSNEFTGSSVSANSDSPLGGATDIRLDFDYRDGVSPWSQWLTMTMSMAEGVTDMTALSGVRFTVKSDQARELRVDLESSSNSAENSGIKMGWDVNIDASATQIEVLFADMAVPDWATDPMDLPADVQASVRGLSFFPKTQGLFNGYLGEGVTDTGFLQVDDIEFF